MILPEKGYKKAVVIAFYAFLSIICTYLFFKYLFRCILPFALAFIIAALTRKPVLYLGKKFRFNRAFSVLVITLFILVTFSTAVYFLFSKILSELSVLSEYLSEERIADFITNASDGITSFGYRHFPMITEKLSPAISDIAKNLDSVLTSFVTGAIPYAAKAIMNIFSAFPSVFLFLGVTILAAFYFGCDYEKITSFVRKQLNEKQNLFLCELKSQFFITILNIVRAYAILITMTFIQLLVGFIIIGIDYATLLAAFIAIIDILPVLGTGTVLIPSSIILFLSGNAKTGLCILLLYVIITIVRQMAEPKILGGCVGLHPIATLMSMYFGIKLAGFKGLFLFPLAVIIIKNLNEKGFIHLYKNIKSSDKKIK